MATRRPRVKVAANLSIRRPSKPTGKPAAELKTETVEACEEKPAVEPEAPVTANHDEQPAVASPLHHVAPVQSDEKPEEEKQQFKLPMPVDNSAKNSSSSGGSLATESTTTSASISHEEPMSPRKQDVRFGYPMQLARKRIRTESLTSNKSLPDGITVNRVARKIATKQEESQRTLENKKEIRKRLTNIENVDKQNLTMFDMIYYNPVNNPMEPPPTLSKRTSVENIPKSIDGSQRAGTRSRTASKSRSPTPAPSTSAPPAKETPAPPVQLTPQLKLGPNGEIILDEASLVIENERDKEFRETLANSDVLYQDEFSGNSGYYTRIKRTKGWSDEETIRFYRCLHTIGTDFSMMLSLFPNRTRRDMKLKFKKEERHNLQLVNKALKHPKQFNIAELRQQFEQEDEELERKKAEKQQCLEEEAKKRRNEQLQRKLLLGQSKNRCPQKRLSRSQRTLTDTHEQLRDAESPNASLPQSPMPQETDDPPASPAQPSELASQSVPAKRVSKKSRKALEAETLFEDSECDLDDEQQSASETQRVSKTDMEQTMPTCNRSLKKMRSLENGQQAHVEATQEVNHVKRVRKMSRKAIEGSLFDKENDNDQELNATPLPSMTESSATPSSDVIHHKRVRKLSQKALESGSYCINDDRQGETSEPSLLANTCDDVDIAPKPASKKPRKTSEPNLFSKDSPGDQKPKVDEQSYLPAGDESLMDSKRSQRVRKMSRKALEASLCAEESDDNDPKSQPYIPNGGMGSTNASSTLLETETVEELPYPPPIYVERNTPVQEDLEPDSTSVITLQNLDDQSRTTCRRREDCSELGELTPVPIELTPVAAMKYEVEADLTYLHLPANNAPVTNPVKTESYTKVQPSLAENVFDRQHKHEIETRESVTFTAMLPAAHVGVDENVDPVTVPANDANSDLFYETTSTELLDVTNVASAIDHTITHQKIEPKTYSALEAQTIVQREEEVQQQVHSAAAQTIVVKSIDINDSDGNFTIRKEENAGTERNECFTTDVDGRSETLPKHQFDAAFKLSDQAPSAESPSSYSWHTPASVAQPPVSTIVEEQSKRTSEPSSVTQPKQMEEDNSDGMEEQTQYGGEDDDDETEPSGFSLENIDINSLVLVESQDASEPNKTIYEIYVVVPETGQLSEKPLDVPPEVIESIRQILEAGDGATKDD
ncbi:transcription factor TFIIIB component B'' homolog [Anopheles albimanus]|uniref:Transcription factor TFIIIB component B'' Myb domain-containing protein n=1 Tax=Anopheles albimanus TaxID=7167 RepID=A0A8W7JB83_ANOAL|nr:transcription factor TFIIIB component B'' homolog [Anopheles albimanus]